MKDEIRSTEIKNIVPEHQLEVQVGNGLYDEFCMKVCNDSERRQCKTICVGLRMIWEVRKLNPSYKHEMEKLFDTQLRTVLESILGAEIREDSKDTEDEFEDPLYEWWLNGGN